MEGKTSGSTRAFAIAGVSSGTGKTTVTLGIIQALKKRGLTVQPFKAGPDYIDPGFHAALTRRPSYNLDTWMMGSEGVKRTFSANLEGAGAAIVEGVMGLFDGKDGTGEEGSTAHIAKLLNLPVLLVVNATGMARSAGAMVKGFEGFDPGVKIRWVILNNVGSKRHCNVLKEAIETNTDVLVIGFLPKEETLKLPERHLGLVTRGDLRGSVWRGFLKKLDSLIETHVDVDGFLGSLKNFKPARPRAEAKPLPPRSPLKKTRIAVALDNAFCFYYRENLEVLESSGAELVFFSPLEDKRLPEGTSGIYIGGGYPELYGECLEANRSIRRQIRILALKGLPVYAECGGLMYLGKTLEGPDGRRYSMVGLFPWTSRMLKKRRALGYREVVAFKDCPFLKKGEKARGHEYHYSEIPSPPRNIKRVFKVSSTDSTQTSIEGYSLKNTLASYVHLHFASNPGFARTFVEKCAAFEENS